MHLLHNIAKNELDKFYIKFENGLKNLSDIEKYKTKSNNELISFSTDLINLQTEIYESIDLYNEEFVKSLNRIKSKFTRKEFFELSLNYDEKSFSRIEKILYKKVERNPIILEVGEELYKKLEVEFFNKYPLHKVYLEKILNLSTISKSQGIRIRNYVYDKELNNYLNQINKRYGTKITKLDDNMLFNTSIDNNTLYDLVGLKVLQSIKGGILVTSRRLSYDSQVYFIKTNKVFVDGHVFKYGEYKIIKSGVKKYMNLLSGTKSVHAFKIINISRNKYHFKF